MKQPDSKSSALCKIEEVPERLEGSLSTKQVAILMKFVSVHPLLASMQHCITHI